MRPSHDTIAVAQPKHVLTASEPKVYPKDVHPTRLQVIPSRTDFARSHAANWSPPVPVTSELEAIRRLKATWKQNPKIEPIYEGYTTKSKILTAAAYDFEIYRSPHAGHEARRFELTSLHYLEVPSAKKLCLDGFLCLGHVKCYVQGVEIYGLSIEGYGDDESPSVVTYVQSDLARKDPDYDIWIRLIKPSQEYKRFQDPFVWVAQLAKHVLDFIDEQPVRSVRLDSFRTDFHSWLIARYPHSTALHEWHQDYRRRVDFRTGVNAYVEFIHHQACNLPNAKQLLAHPLWAECMARGLATIKMQNPTVQYTLATPGVYNCFKDMYFRTKIRAMSPSSLVGTEQERRKSQLGFPKFPTSKEESMASWTDPPCRPYNNTKIQVGDVVAFDPTATDTRFWGAGHWQWFGYVQRIELQEDGVQRLFILFLYTPRETNIFKAKYPLQNELFFSDNCNCTEGELLSTEVTGRCEVEWMPSMIPTKRFFVRQTYITQDSAFVSFEKAHRICICMKGEASAIKSYQCGDTVYITKTLDGSKILEPVVVRQIDKVSGNATVRKLLRLGRDCAQLAARHHRTGDIAVNELVLTDDYDTVQASRIQRRCHVRFVPKQDLLLNQVPFPYNRGGAGDLWIVSMGLATAKEGPRLMYLARLPDRFHEGPDLSLPTTGARLRGLSIFSGGGSLDRGLQEGGAVDFQTTVDFSAEAMHTQLANTQDPSKVRFFCGSVDDYLKAALDGKHKLIALIGAVNFLAAGSPCPGFSTLQRNITSEASLRNASHISTFCSFVDLYRPEYAILENVVSMASTRTGYEDQNVLSQLVACLVAMGYQVNQYIMDAWSYGSAQHRSRVFLTIAAPGLEPITQPWHTHSRPDGHTIGKSLGMLPNRQRFGEREQYPTPFAHLSARAATSDLCNIGNGNMQTCVPHPDHRTPYPPSRKDRALLQCIPRHPPGCGYKEAFRLGLIPPSLQKPGKETGKAFSRIKEAGLVPTITTGQSIQDSCNGAIVHWSQDRPITILEARRAQGWPDEEPIIGSLAQQYKIVGNGVDRKVSFALGLQIRRVVEQNIKRSESGTSPIGLVEEMIVDAEEVEEVDDTASVSSKIHVYVPPQSKRAVRPSTSTSTPEQLHARTNLSESGNVVAANFSDVPGLDRSPNARDGKPNSAKATPRLLNATGFISHISATVTKGLKGLSLRSRTTLPTHATSAVHGKRGRGDDMDDARHDASCPNDDETNARKRARTSEEAQTYNFNNNTIDTIDVRISSAETRGVETNMRHTRHSGLEIDFAPRQWNKKPEREHATRK